MTFKEKLQIIKEDKKIKEEKARSEKTKRLEEAERAYKERLDTIIKSIQNEVLEFAQTNTGSYYKTFIFYEEEDYKFFHEDLIKSLQSEIDLKYTIKWFPENWGPSHSYRAYGELKLEIII